MFYEAAEIDEQLICPYCKNKYTDPRIVECGVSFCMPCINQMLISNKNGFKCPACEDFHEIPSKGYLKNSNLAKLCAKKAAEPTDSKLAEAFKSQLDEFKLKLEDLSNENKIRFVKIKEYCDGLINLDEHDLTSSLPHLNKKEPLSIKLLNNDQIAVAYRLNESNCIAIEVFDKNFNLVYERVSKSGRNFKNFLLNSMANNSIIFCLVKPNIELNCFNDKIDDEECCENYKNIMSVVKIFDEKLNKLKKIFLFHWIISLSSFDDKIYLISSFSEMMQVYDSNLVLLMSIGQSKPNLPFYIPWYIKKVQICEDYYVFLDKSEIKFLDRKTGWVKKMFKIDASDFLLNTDAQTILAYNNDSNKVLCYDFEGKSQTFDINFRRTFNHIKLVDCLKDKFLFLDSKSICLYIS